MSDKIDKVYDLMETMYSEFTKRFDGMGNDITRMDGTIKGLSNAIVLLETKFNDKFNALNEDVKIIKDDVKGIKDKLNVHDVKLDSIRDDVNVLIGRTKRHSFEIGAIKRNRGIER